MLLLEILTFYLITNTFSAIMTNKFDNPKHKFPSFCLVIHLSPKQIGKIMMNITQQNVHFVHRCPFSMKSETYIQQTLITQKMSIFMLNPSASSFPSIEPQHIHKLKSPISPRLN